MIATLWPARRYIGFWIERPVSPGADAGFSILRISVHLATLSVRLTGLAVDGKGQMLARWRSVRVVFDRRNGRLISIEQGERRDSTRACGVTSFTLDPTNTDAGRGFYVEQVDGQVEAHSVIFERATRANIDRLLS